MPKLETLAFKRIRVRELLYRIQRELRKLTLEQVALIWHRSQRGVGMGE